VIGGQKVSVSWPGLAVTRTPSRQEVACDRPADIPSNAYFSFHPNWRHGILNGEWFSNQNERNLDERSPAEFPALRDDKRWVRSLIHEMAETSSGRVTNRQHVRLSTMFERLMGSGAESIDLPIRLGQARVVDRSWRGSDLFIVDWNQYFLLRRALFVSEDSGFVSHRSFTEPWLEAFARQLWDVWNQRERSNNIRTMLGLNLLADSLARGRRSEVDELCGELQILYVDQGLVDGVQHREAQRKSPLHYQHYNLQWWALINRILEDNGRAEQFSLEPAITMVADAVRSEKLERAQKVHFTEWMCAIRVTGGVGNSSDHSVVGRRLRNGDVHRAIPPRLTRTSLRLRDFANPPIA
jgi:hypothetical protein